MKSIDQEIYEVEQRLHLREAAIKHDSQRLKQRTVKALMSPVTIVGAVALGFLAAGFVGRRRAKAHAAARFSFKRRKKDEQTKALAAGSLLMTAATWLIRSQFGGPVGLANFVVSKIKSRSAPSKVSAHQR